MKKNVGKTDRIVRVILGIVIIATGIYLKSWWGVVGAGIIIPSIMGSDPLYNLLNINTNKNK